MCGVLVLVCMAVSLKDFVPVSHGDWLVQLGAEGSGQGFEPCTGTKHFWGVLVGLGIPKR
jgi:hypothetical protein